MITREIEARDGDVGAGIVAAAQWIAQTLPMYSLNCVLATPSELWSLRYPDAHRLMMLERASGGPTGIRHLDGASASGTVRIRSAAPGDRVLLTSYGSGAGSDSFSLRITDAILERQRRAPATRDYIARRVEIDYATYVRFTGKLKK